SVAGHVSVPSRSAGATRYAPAIPDLGSIGAACATAATPQLCATRITGRVAARTAATIRSTHFSRSGLSQSSCSTMRAVLRLRAQRDCQWSGPEPVQPGTSRISTSDVRMRVFRSAFSKDPLEDGVDVLRVVAEVEEGFELGP